MQKNDLGLMTKMELNVVIAIPKKEGLTLVNTTHKSVNRTVKFNCLCSLDNH